MNRLRWCWFAFGLLLLAPARLAPARPRAQREEAQLERSVLDLTPFASKRGKAPLAQLEPVLAGDKVLVTSTLRLFAFEARTAELAWTAGPPGGWGQLEPRRLEDLLGALEPERLLVAPAAGERAAVAALQIPQGQAGEDWHGLEIQRALPERRLFAFELATGRALWNHAPPSDWDGRSGAFAQRMNVCASPLVVGARVFVPCTRDESSIDYHVACYELETGAKLWTTFVKRGQIERNMFGFQAREFAAAPLVAAGTRVLAQTGLGMVAALDVKSGRVLWKSDYAPIPLPKVKNYQHQPPLRPTVWRNATPLVIGDVVLAAPLDCAELLALDLSSGKRLWTAAETTWKELAPGSRVSGFDRVIADADTLYLGGQDFTALPIVDWRAGPASRARWTRALGDVPPVAARRGGDALFVTHDSRVVELDLASGEIRRALATGVASGLLVTDESLFVLADGALRRIER